jgi:hypothetical protein
MFDDSIPRFQSRRTIRMFLSKFQQTLSSDDVHTVKISHFEIFVYKKIGPYLEQRMNLKVFWRHLDFFRRIYPVRDYQPYTISMQKGDR